MQLDFEVWIDLDGMCTLIFSICLDKPEPKCLLPIGEGSLIMDEVKVRVCVFVCVRAHVRTCMYVCVHVFVTWLYFVYRSG